MDGYAQRYGCLGQGRQCDEPLAAQCACRALWVCLAGQLMLMPSVKACLLCMQTMQPADQLLHALEQLVSSVPCKRMRVSSPCILAHL